MTGVFWNLDVKHRDFSGNFCTNTHQRGHQSVAWYACEAPLGKERYVRLNEWKTRRSVC